MERLKWQKKINNTTHFLLNAKQNRKIDQFTEIIKYAERNVTWSILFYSFLTDKRKQYGQRVCHLLYHWKRECGFVYSGKILCFGWHITLGIQETFEEVNGLRSIPQGKEKILNMKAYKYDEDWEWYDRLGLTQINRERGLGRKRKKSLDYLSC